MNGFHLIDDNSDRHAPDLESAFNDGFHTAANSVSAALVRWMVILWAMSTAAVGIFVVARAVLEYSPEVWSGLRQIFS